MQLTKQQKIYAAVLGLAVAAFGFDRFVLGPAEADASDELAVTSSAVSGRTTSRRPARPAGTGPRSASASAGAPAVARPAAAPSAAPVGKLAVRLQEASQAHGLDLDRVGDAFRPSAVWVGAPKQVTTTAELRNAARDFQQKHKLMAVMKNTAGGVAIIDNITVSVGQKIDGFRLVAVRDRSAVLRAGSQKVELRLPEDPMPGSAAEKMAGTGGL